MPHPLDKQHLEDVILHSPKQFAAGIAEAEHAVLPEGTFERILVAGMGGSCMAPELISEGGLSRVPVLYHRGYGLPGSMQKDTLVIVSSFSGNTEESLSAYDAAREQGLSILGIAAGGELETRCTNDHVPFIRIPADPPTMQPRSATGYGVGILAVVFARLGLASRPSIVEDIRGLEPALLARMDELRTRGEQLAMRFTAETPVLYASDQYAAVARILKIKINENAKTPAFWNVFPELNHNEMIGWTKPQGAFHILLLQDSEDHPRVVKRMEITSTLLRERGISCTMVPIEGATRLEKIFGTLLVGEWMSYFLALTLGINPSPVEMVEDLKRRLKE